MSESTSALGANLNPGNTTPEKRRITPRGVLVWTISGFFALFFAYNVFSGIGNVIGITGYAAALDAGISASGWAILIGGVVLPIVVFGLCVFLGRRRSLGLRALILFTGLAVVAVITVDILHRFRLGAFFV
ncbi:hypothetical protein [Lysinibacter cavernae]|uniref:Uncharacterized protein n=1 Tax=Lysinibacter cavernae TaxID=1640652 RepID=A0A7X5QYL8_9MICO|nr:hypothetical protein [Lysinibacter cavernae]NIH52172.1 hypothetical protein [Lysinibacter cavernae]